MTMVASDTEAMFAHVEADAHADATRIGCVGYCMSGPFSFAMACMFPDRIKAAASVYGVRLFGEGSSVSIADRATGELYFACAEFDDYAPTEMIDALEAHLASIGTTPGWSATPVCTTASRSHCVPCTTSRLLSATGSACSRCSPATWADGVGLTRSG